MNEEEKKIKEMEELGINLTDSPSETVEVTPPTKLKLQALTFMIIGKIERHFLNSRLNQSRQVRNLATTGLKRITSMNDKDKKDLIDKFSGITILEENLYKFDEYYQRVMGHGRRSLKIPSVNFGVLKSLRKKVMSNLVEAYKPMNDVFFETKKELDGVELSDKEKSSIRQNVYKALSGGTDKEIEEYASGFNDETDKKLDDLVSRRNQEQGLDAFFNNISPISSSQVKLENDELNHILNGGKVKKDDASPEKIESGELDGILNGGRPILSNEESPIFNDNSSSFTPLRPAVSVQSDSFKPNPEENGAFVLSDDDIANLTGKFVEKDSMSMDNHGDMMESNSIFPSGMFEDAEVDNSEDIYNDDDSDIFVPDVEDLRRQLEESTREVEQKRQEKAQAEKEYEAEKQERENKENELAKSKKELSQMKDDIERKKRKQVDIDELNKKIKVALKIQKQIAENKRQALQEEEETKKYKTNLEQEKESRDEISKEQEMIQSEQRELRRNTEEIDSDLRGKLRDLENAKRELQGFPTYKGGVSFRNGNPSFVDIQDDADFLTGLSTISNKTKRMNRVVGTDPNDLYVTEPIQGRDEPMSKKR